MSLVHLLSSSSSCSGSCAAVASLGGLLTGVLQCQALQPGFAVDVNGCRRDCVYLRKGLEHNNPCTGLKMPAKEGTLAWLPVKFS